MVVIHMMRMVQYKYSTDFKFSFFWQEKLRVFYYGNISSHHLLFL